MTIEFHRAAIAFHQAEIDKLTGVPAPSGFDPNDWKTWWPAMLVQYANEGKPHPWVDWAPGVLPEHAGNKAPMPRCFDTHRIIWEAAQRGDPVAEGRPPVAVEGINGWPGPDGKAFRIAEYQRLGTQAVLDAINWLDSESPECAAWKASPAVAPFLPKSPPAMFPLSR